MPPRPASRLRHFAAVARQGPQYRAPLVVFGLGNHTNPNTKHSAGHNLVESLARCAASRLNSSVLPFSLDKKLNAWTTTLTIPDAKDDKPSSLLLVKSKELMNRSGSTALLLVKRYSDVLQSKRLLVLHDELSLPVGDHRGQFGGSAKGHNGIRDIADKIKTDNFHRFRIGIDRPPNKKDVAEWVLGPSMKAELELLSENGKSTVAAWQYLVEQGLVSA